MKESVKYGILCLIYGITPIIPLFYYHLDMNRAYEVGYLLACMLLIPVVWYFCLKAIKIIHDEENIDNEVV